jgi:GTP-binding protein
VVGLDPIDIGDTIACPDMPSALPRVAIDEPTLNMMFRVNDSPFAGREGKFVTSRQVWDRLEKELHSNVALKAERSESGGGEAFLVSGRGLMHLGVLLETMRREGYELGVGKPEVILRRIDGKVHEPIEQLVVDCPAECQNAVMSLVSDRRAEVVRMDPKAGAGDYVHMEFTIPARGLIGLRTRMLTATQGRAIMHHNLLRYEPLRGEVPKRQAGVIISSEPGQVAAYSLDALYDRGVFFVKPGDQVYEGQVVGEHCKDNDIIANVTRNKKHSNVRASGSDDATRVRPAREMSLEACLEYIQEDELVEVTPTAIRMRKRQLKESERRKTTRQAKAQDAAGV